MMRSERNRPANWRKRIALVTKPAASKLFEQHLRERRLRVMKLFAESTFEVDHTLKSWLEKTGPDRIERTRVKDLLKKLRR